MKFVLFFISSVLLKINFIHCKLTASFKETSFHGLDDLNINIIKSFQLSDFTLGFNKHIQNINDVFKSPDSLFLKKATNLFRNNLYIDSDFNVASQVLKLSTKLINDKRKILLCISGSNKSKVTDIEIDKKFTKLSMNFVYNLPKKILTTSTSYKIDEWDAMINLDYDTLVKDPILSITKHFDESNEVIPSLSFKTKSLIYAWKHKWNGGSLTSILIPNESIELDWKDYGYHGDWNTKGSLSLKDSSRNKLSISREWKL